jgi:mono/diheme cytochrome c family protein
MTNKGPVCGIVVMFAVVAVLWSGICMGEVDKGKQLYTNKCQLCHGISGDGKSHAAAFLNSNPADFTDPKFWEKEDEKKMAEAIENGKGEMPAFNLKPDEIKTLIDYITHNFKPQNK